MTIGAIGPMTIRWVDPVTPMSPSLIRDGGGGGIQEVVVGGKTSRVGGQGFSNEVEREAPREGGDG